MFFTGIEMSNKIYIIAEIGNNHNGSVKKAKKLIDVAKKAGVDAVKFQSFRGKDIVATNVLTSNYPSWDDGTYKYWYQFLDSIALPLAAHQELIDYSNENKLDFITTPVSSDILDYLEQLSGIFAYKIASMDLTNHDLLNSLSKTNKNLILSTGMGTLDEISKSLGMINNKNVSILHCISDYPLSPINANLSNINILQTKFPNNNIGFSDHSLGHELSLLAVNFGARIIEKHITLDRNDPLKAEHHFALEPKELATLVKWLRVFEKNSNLTTWQRSTEEKKITTLFRRSFRYKKDLQKNQILTEDDLTYIRPGEGIGMEEKNLVIGKKLKKNIKQNEACLVEHVY